MPAPLVVGFRKENGDVTWSWLEVIAALEIARRHLKELAPDIPDDWVAINQQIQQMVAELVRLASSTGRPGAESTVGRTLPVLPVHGIDQQASQTFV